MEQPNQRAFYYPQMQSLASAIACLFVLYLLLPRLPRGLPRLFCVCPCLLILVKVPFSCRPHALRAILSFSFLWVCPTKLLLRCWDISSDYPGDGFLYFLSTSVLPLRVKGVRRGSCHTDSLKAASATTLQGALSLFLPQLLCFFAILNIFRYPHISVQLHHALYCLLLYFGLEGAVGLISGFTSLLLGLELHPFFDKPFLASSLSEFWGRRWNCLSSYMLRETVYVPILHFLSPKKLVHGTPMHLSSVDKATTSPQIHTSQSVDVGACDKDGAGASRGMQEKDDRNIVMHGNEFQCAGRVPLLARAVAMLATFAASGLIHELIFYCITQTSPTWEVTAFFSLHGVATVLEVSARRTCLRHIILPQPIAIMCTLGFIYVSAAWLFMPPVMQSGVDMEMLAELRSTLKVVMDLLVRL
ncbi:hypothetical protein L7F22_051958 [Adiantum nelumboides]|nr:hypothetical protein [Adiantum nelumboides]